MSQQGPVIVNITFLGTCVNKSIQLGRHESLRSHATTVQSCFSYFLEPGIGCYCMLYIMDGDQSSRNIDKIFYIIIR